MAGKDLGTLSQALLKNFLKEVFKNFKNFNHGGFFPLCLCGADFFEAVYALLIPAAPRSIPSSGIGTAVASLRYRIEMVQVSC